MNERNPGSVTRFTKLSRTALSHFTGRFSRFLGGSTKLKSAGRFLRSQLWAWPILAGAILAAAGWLVNEAMENAMRKNREAYLSSVRDAVVKALQIWVEDHCSIARITASDDRLLAPLLELVEFSSKGAPAGGSLASAVAQSELRQRLAKPMADAKCVGYFIVDKNGVVLAADVDAPVGKELAGFRRAFFDGVLDGKAAVSRPFLSPLLLPDKQGQLRANLPSMFAGAPIRDKAGKPWAALGLRLRPEEQFSALLATSQFGDSGETYAFDREGVFVSNSRFDSQLVELGLLADRPDSQSVLELRVCDPEVDMTKGQRPKQRRSEQPLTAMAVSAIAGQTGVNGHGYRDYRGVEVVGAWTWLPELDIGIATEVDAAEAKSPLRVLRIAFGSLIGLLFLAAVAIYFAMWHMAKQQRALQEAVVEAKQLGQYTLEEKLGEGGMGAVYKAKHAMLRRPTAIKLLHPNNLSEAALSRFEREVQATSQLTHPNTIAIFDYGRTGEGVFYYAMEYLNGINLDDLVSGFGSLPEARAIHIMKQVCGSLAEAHAAGIIHRDIKPANVLLTQRGGVYDFVKVLDFGLAKGLEGADSANLTSSGMVVGTPLYLAPEAINTPDRLDARADVYAIGAVGYFLLTGMPVFSGNSAIEVCMKHVNEMPTPPSIRRGSPVEAGFEALILQCLAKDRAARPASAAELLVSLESCSDSRAWTAIDARAWWTNYAKQIGDRAKTATPPLTGFVSVENQVAATGAFEP